MEQQWYIVRNQQKIGPFSTNQMQQMATIGELLRNEMILDSSQKNCCLAETVEVLFSPVIKKISPAHSPSSTPVSPGVLSRYPVLIGTSMVLVLLLCGFFFGFNNQKPHVAVDAEMVVAEKAEETKSQVVKQELGTPKEEAVKPEETKSQAEAKSLSDAGLVHLRKGQLEEAIKRYSESIKLDPSSHYSYTMRAVAFDRAGKPHQAIADRTIVLEFFLLENPQKPLAVSSILVDRGLSYIDLGKHSEARNDYTKAIKFDPDNANPYMCRGLSYFSTNNFDEAIKDLTKAIGLSDKNYKGITELYYRGKSYLALNKKDEGIADLAKAKLIDPKRFSDLELGEFYPPANKNNTAAPKVEIINLDKDVKLEMVLIPAGKFVMGSPASEKGRYKSETQHEVTLTKPFYMGKYEVTQAQWESVMGNNPSAREDKGAKLPVTNVSWNDCQEFIKKLNASTKGGYRLPYEAEWEHACRAGTSTTYSYGDNLTKSDANIEEGGSIKAVGSYKPNAFGLYDMHGNVWEWCEDWYGSLQDGEVIDPKGPTDGDGPVLRGGAYYQGASNARSSSRDGQLATKTSIFGGFRLARTP
jgi:formylglycine-generating enzyme required for sulfatase activity/regulator of sirC expression with transglutaminase-like and TPR domain